LNFQNFSQIVINFTKLDEDSLFKLLKDDLCKMHSECSICSRE